MLRQLPDERRFSLAPAFRPVVVYGFHLLLRRLTFPFSGVFLVFCPLLGTGFFLYQFPYLNEEDTFPFLFDVFPGIIVFVMMSLAFRAYPFPQIQALRVRVLVSSSRIEASSFMAASRIHHREYERFLFFWKGNLAIHR